MTIAHIDIDAFYVQAECLRNPQLKGKPVAVSQHNRGGFVAVSLEARAKGIRKGDGAGEGGRAAIEFLSKRLSLPAARQQCPGLQVLEMDMPFYRKVTSRLEEALKTAFPRSQVERASVDDFYVDLKDEVARRLEGGRRGRGRGMGQRQRGGETIKGVCDSALCNLRVVVGREFFFSSSMQVSHSRNTGNLQERECAVKTEWRANEDENLDTNSGGTEGIGSDRDRDRDREGFGLVPAHSVLRHLDETQSEEREEIETLLSLLKDIRASIRKVGGVTCSASLAPNRLLARLASPLTKPDGGTLVLSSDPGSRAGSAVDAVGALESFLRASPLREVPLLRGEMGAQLEKLVISHMRLMTRAEEGGVESAQNGGRGCLQGGYADGGICFDSSPSFRFGFCGDEGGDSEGEGEGEDDEARWDAEKEEEGTGEDGEQEWTSTGNPWGQDEREAMGSRRRASNESEEKRTAGVKGKDEERRPLPSLVDLRCVPVSLLFQHFGKARGSWLSEICWGRDGRGVTERGAPKTMIAERSFCPLSGHAELFSWSEKLSAELLRRLLEERPGEVPRRVVVRWRDGYSQNKMGMPAGTKAAAADFPQSVTSLLSASGGSLETTRKPLSSSSSSSSSSCLPLTTAPSPAADSDSPSTYSTSGGKNEEADGKRILQEGPRKTGADNHCSSSRHSKALRDLSAQVVRLISQHTPPAFDTTRLEQPGHSASEAKNRTVEVGTGVTRLVVGATGFPAQGKGNVGGKDIRTFFQRLPAGNASAAVSHPVEHLESQDEQPDKKARGASRREAEKDEALDDSLPKAPPLCVSEASALAGSRSLLSPPTSGVFPPLQLTARKVNLKRRNLGEQSTGSPPQKRGGEEGKLMKTGSVNPNHQSKHKVDNSQGGSIPGRIEETETKTEPDEKESDEDVAIVGEFAAGSASGRERTDGDRPCDRVIKRPRVVQTNPSSSTKEQCPLCSFQFPLNQLQKHFDSVHARALDGAPKAFSNRPPAPHAGRGVASATAERKRQEGGGRVGKAGSRGAGGTTVRQQGRGHARGTGKRQLTLWDGSTSVQTQRD
uniref:UmuC domain-containing protein n=1 Tax=Chromera velia CCMP2878 TaxID=1169474 RepID=A0A0G4HSP9_9ALVE|eukprot:Cvel_8333.t1-p1 / transcript=Cvel_8333.t1 / gene=Cvel_8333 / organism=Chromera_velia_CCMP2878 / gene_product=DNA polymerase eta, putative / transcript_product=DNA polymerase eta, putative / location=Cvel_scaffold458:69698-75706(-) / protein_length=1061 / sequence_SO=supercontig / SO=protein_coding / is_pseudo=false